jgi:hypothetical protein
VNKLPFDVAERWIIGSINRSYTPPGSEQ